MKVLTSTLYKEHCELYTEIHGSIAVNSCQIELSRKDIILLSNVSVIFYKTGSRTGLENSKFIRLTSQQALILLTILIQKSRKQSYRKDKIGNHLKLRT